MVLLFPNSFNSLLSNLLFFQQRTQKFFEKGDVQKKKAKATTKIEKYLQMTAQKNIRFLLITQKRVFSKLRGKFFQSFANLLKEKFFSSSTSFVNSKRFNYLDKKLSHARTFATIKLLKEWPTGYFADFFYKLGGNHGTVPPWRTQMLLSHFLLVFRAKLQ